MWNLRYLYRIDFRMIPILLGLMTISLLVIATTTCDAPFGGENLFFTHYVKNQLKWFGIGAVAYLALALFDYRRLREWAWIAYVGSILLLLGLFFTASILKVHRWYRIPIIHMMVQPSECTKLALVLTLSWFLEKKGQAVSRWSTCMQAFAIVLPPFLLILKQPDLGSALVLLPMTLGMFYFGGIHRRVVAALVGIGMIALGAVLVNFFRVCLARENAPHGNDCPKRVSIRAFKSRHGTSKSGKNSHCIGRILREWLEEKRIHCAALSPYGANRLCFSGLYRRVWLNRGLFSPALVFSHSFIVVFG